MTDLQQLPKLAQRQDSLTDQLNDLHRVANRLGMYDAADWLRQQATLGPPSIRHGCHCDLDEGAEPDGCVIDEGLHEHCVHARVGMRKEQCEHWQPIRGPIR